MSTACGIEQQPSLVVVCGPTASGKTALALRIAEHFPVEIISADSRQVYRRMDIGTAKATAEERARVPHHLLDVVDPDENFSAADFLQLGRAAAADIRGRGRLPLVVGGTGLYIEALLRGLVDAPGADPDLRRELVRWEEKHGPGSLHKRLEAVDPVLAGELAPRNLVRIVRALEVFYLSGQPLSELQARHAAAASPFRVLIIALDSRRELLYERIDRRVEAMMAEGLLDETEALLGDGYSPKLKALQTIGYRECVNHLVGNISLPDAVAQIQQNSRRYAKRQITWFKRNNKIIWLDSLTEFAKVLKLIDHFTMSS